ncbi:MAG TPA: HD domain-containing protein [Alphaproteobacteria bacterium]|nr:HD domain-containing protein [Alphaproteobacteria bacterium]
MTNKYSKHTAEFLDNKTNSIISLFFEFAQLKNLYREGWLRRGVSKEECESVADHSFLVGVLGYCIASEYRPDLDAGKVMLLGIFHEPGEIHAGDMTPHDKVSKEEKHRREYESVKKVFSRLSNPDKYINLWLEFEEQKTPESRFTKHIDCLEMVLQATLYEKMNYKNLDEFFPYVQEKIKSGELRPIMDEILKLR